MKDINKFINNSMQNKTKVNAALNNEETLADKVKRADGIMTNIDNKVNLNSQVKRKLVQNVTFALTPEDISVINEQIKRYMLLEGEPLTKSLLIRVSLDLFSKLNDDELVELVSSINHIERGRPKAR